MDMPRSILRVWLISILFASSMLVLPAFSQTIRLDGGAFAVNEWHANWPAPEGGFSSIFAVYTSADGPAVLGEYAIEGDSIVFRPLFPLAVGVRYRAVFHLPGGTPIETIFDGPKPDAGPASRVTHIYPSANVLPSNQLKFYVQFSQPMSRGEAWKHIHLVDAHGKPVDSPFFEAEELWDADYRQLTVLFDPGRIKRGLRENDELGPPIKEGEQYTLTIDREFLDARGVPLQEEFRKLFRGASADRTPINPKRWQLSQPKAGTVDPLTITFTKPFDYALLRRAFAIPGMNGTATVDRDETQWHFTPDQPWKAGEYKLIVDLSLEDLAGNRIDRAFDVDTQQSPVQASTTSTIALAFAIIQ
jgi:hypothetical protein